MINFPHLSLKDSFRGAFNFKSSSRKKNAKTLANLSNKVVHGTLLYNGAKSVKEWYSKELIDRGKRGLPTLDKDVIPIFLQVEPDGFDIESLKGFGIEIISEEENGFIIGSSIDGFRSLESKIEQFTKQGKAVTTAKLWDIVIGGAWRVEHILSQELQSRWHEIQDNEQLIVDVSIACYLKSPDYPRQEKNESTEHFENKVERWRDRNTKYLQERDDLEFDRQEKVQKFLEFYDAEIISDFVSDHDSFGFRVKLVGQALKDFVITYPYVFEVVEYLEIEPILALDGEGDTEEFELLAPLANAPKVCIIDSGIMEGHRLLAPAILTGQSRNFDVSLNQTVADEVLNGGHGTRVAGAVLYGNTIIRDEAYQAPCFIYNARILDRNNQISSRLFPPELMEDVCENFNDAHIFNVSINNKVPCRTTHMSQWAASLDRLSNNDGHIFVVSAGNLSVETFNPNNPGIKNHRTAGRDYPHYLLENASRIADPAQSLFSITVGSVCIDSFEDVDHKSFGAKDHISSFSRSGLGLWNSIKPEVVEYGGDWVTEKRGDNLVFKDQTCPELVVSKGPGIARDTIGTSFAAPKVSHILARLVSQFPQYGTLFHKALLIQSAQLPKHVGYPPNINDIKHYGYGIPNAERAVENSVKRITFTTSGSISAGQADLYLVKIPKEIRTQGEDYNILIEVSLCYTAKNRRTRRSIKSYLSKWLSWQSAPMGQNFEAFKEDVLKDIENYGEIEERDVNDQPTNIPWVINESSTKGTVKGINRQSSANQKDWAIVKSYQLSEEIIFAIVGHNGWEKDIKEEVPFAFVVSFEILNAEVPLYELMSQVNIEVEQESQIELF